jgi:integrase
MLDLQKNNHSGSNIRLCRDVLSGIYGAAIDEEIVNGNPVKDILKRLGIAKKSSNEVEPFTGDEIYHLLNTCKRDFGTYHLFFLTACRTGMRLGELLGLEWSDVNWNENYILVQRSFKNGEKNRPKNGLSRRVDISDQLKCELLKWNDAEDSDEKLIFHKNGIHISQNSIRNVFNRLLDRARLPHKRIHDLRHTYASLLLTNGETPVYVKEQMGHSGIDITVNTYGHLIPGCNRQAVNHLDEICSGGDS